MSKLWTYNYGRVKTVSHLRFYLALLSRDFIARDKVAACDCAVACRDFVALTNQTITTDYDILASGLVLVDCLAKRKP